MNEISKLDEQRHLTEVDIRSHCINIQNWRK